MLLTGQVCIVRSYHLDTLNALNFAHKAKKIEVRDIENEPDFKGHISRDLPVCRGSIVQRQPLRPLGNSVHNASVPGAPPIPRKMIGQPSKAFSVYSDRGRSSNAAARALQPVSARQSPLLKRPLDSFTSSTSRPAKRRVPYSIPVKLQPAISEQVIEDMIERKVTDVLTARALDQPSIAPQPEISEEVQRRLDMLEKRIENKDDGREQGLAFLLMAKQHAVRGEDSSALRMYKLAKEIFPRNERLDLKIDKLQLKIQGNKKSEEPTKSSSTGGRRKNNKDEDEDFNDVHCDEQSYQSSDDVGRKVKGKRPLLLRREGDTLEPSPRSRQLLNIVNSGDVGQIRMLKGIGAKKAEAIIDGLAGEADGGGRTTRVSCLQDLSRLKGVGRKAVESMKAGLV